MVERPARGDSGKIPGAPCPALRALLALRRAAGWHLPGKQGSRGGPGPRIVAIRRPPVPGLALLGWPSRCRRTRSSPPSADAPELTESTCPAQEARYLFPSGIRLSGSPFPSPEPARRPGRDHRFLSGRVVPMGSARLRFRKRDASGDLRFSPPSGAGSDTFSLWRFLLRSPAVGASPSSGQDSPSGRSRPLERAGGNSDGERGGGPSTFLQVPSDARVPVREARIRRGLPLVPIRENPC